MLTDDDLLLHATAEMQAVIRSNESSFDDIETISVQPSFEMLRGKVDAARPYIQVRARRVEELRKKLLPTLARFPVQIMQASLEEQMLRIKTMVRAGIQADSLQAKSAWRTVQPEAVLEARDYSSLTYRPLEPSLLKPITGHMDLIIHVSPEAGWSNLRSFLQPGNWVVGMYDFTAPHIRDQMEAALEGDNKLTLVLDRKVSLPTQKQIEAHPDDVKASDVTEVSLVYEYRQRLGERLAFRWASTGAHAQFASAYHIKVAVRDRQAFWMSSGNWQSSNQPATDFLNEATPEGAVSDDVAREAARYNREWHVLCQHQGLSEVFAKYIERDYEEAEGAPGPKNDEGGSDEEAVMEPTESDIPDDEFVMELSAPRPGDAELEAVRRPRKFFKPLQLSGIQTVHPILTPDNYAEVVAPVIEEATTRLWFQNQSLNVTATRSEGYDRLLSALKNKSWELDDCRIIFRDFYRTQTKDTLRGLRAFGFNMAKIHVMQNCHTKGILVDSKFAVVGSHNWTNEGTTYNRDASLLFDDVQIAQYLESVFDHDWQYASYSLDVAEESAEVLLYHGEQPKEGAATQIVQLQDHDGEARFAMNGFSKKNGFSRLTEPPDSAFFMER
jgi:PLD-like domain